MAPFQFEYKIEYFDSVAFHAIIIINLVIDARGQLYKKVIKVNYIVSGNVIQ